MCSNRSMAKEWHLCLLSAPIMCLFKLQFPCLLSHYHLAVKQCLLDLCLEVWTECLLLFLSGDPQSSLGVYIEEEAQAQPAFQLAKPLSPKQTALHTSPLASFLEGTTSLFFVFFFFNIIWSWVASVAMIHILQISASVLFPAWLFPCCCIKTHLLNMHRVTSGPCGGEWEDTDNCYIVGNHNVYGAHVTCQTRGQCSTSVISTRLPVLITLKL